MIVNPVETKGIVFSLQGHRRFWQNYSAGLSFTTGAFSWEKKEMKLRETDVAAQILWHFSDLIAIGSSYRLQQLQFDVSESTRVNARADEGSILGRITF